MSENRTSGQNPLPRHGEFCWTEITARDLDRSVAFYENVFGWQFRRSASAGDDMEYIEFSTDGGEPIGGLYDVDKMPGRQEVPPHFISYVAVDDVNDTANLALELGGRVLRPPTDIPNVGRMAVIADPTGGTMALIKLEQ